ncbi:MAG: hypothetical protein L0228_09330 [Planctomycetes bacterium]|nr:hypothetical protein [Planctomycetota bacterium]
MSWKCFVTTSLLCVLATPAFAAPTVQVVPGGTFANNHLNAAGDWVWHVRLSQSSPPVDVDGAGPLPAGSPLGAELGFAETSGELLSATNLADGFDTSNPGSPIFGWEVYSDTNGDLVIDSTPPTDDEPVGLQMDATLDQIFAALGSVDYLADVDGKGFIEIIIDGPNSAGILETDLVMSGAYGVAGDMGRISELDGDMVAPDSVNYDTFSGTFSRMALAGDTDLNGAVNFDDFQNLLGNYNLAGEWYQGDFNDSGTVDFNDFQDLLANYNAVYNVNSGAGAGGGGAVPEPTTAVLVLLAGSLLFAGRGRAGRA